MPAHRKFLFFLFIATVIFLFSQKVVFAATFSFSNAPETVDKNTSFTITATLEGLKAGNKYYLRAVFSHPDTPTSYFGYTKNNSGVWYNGTPSPLDHTQFFQITMDSNRTWSGSLEVKPDTEISAYKGAGIYNFKIGRYTEAGSGPTWTSNTAQITIITVATPTSTPTPPPSSSPTPASSPTKATYKINKVKDKEGNTLSSVKIYVDGVYVHHYAPETLTFCDRCQCDSYVDCGFGEHTIKLEKSGYQDWSETKTMSAGDSYEINPVMALSDGSASTPTPTYLPAATSALTRSPSRTFSPTTVLGRDLEDVFREELATEGSIGSIAGEVTESGELISPTATPSSRFKKVLGGIFLSLGGLSVLGAGAFPLIRKKILVKIKRFP